MDKRIIFCKNSKFLQEYVISMLSSDGLQKSSVFVLEKGISEKKFYEDVYTVPLFGTKSLGIIQYDKEFESEFFEKKLDEVPKHAYLMFMMEKIPLRLTKRLKDNVYFRDIFSEEESREYLLKLLLALGKKVSTSAQSFLMTQMQQDPSQTINVLTKLASLTPHLYLDEQIIKNSFEHSLDAFRVPEMFFKSKGLEADRILNKTDFASFRTLFQNFILTLIRFKLAEKKSLGEKMRIIKASPDTIKKFEDLVRPVTLKSLENRFLFYSYWLDKGKDIFLIKFLTTKF